MTGSYKSDWGHSARQIEDVETREAAEDAAFFQAAEPEEAAPEPRETPE